jgi:hypothetical protein
VTLARFLSKADCRAKIHDVPLAIDLDACPRDPKLIASSVTAGIIFAISGVSLGIPATSVGSLWPSRVSGVMTNAFILCIIVLPGFTFL